MGLNGAFADDKCPRYFGIRFARCDLPQNFEFPFGEFSERVDFILPQALQFLHDARSDTRIKYSLSVRGFANGSGKFVGFHVFEQIGDRSSAHGREDIFILVVGGDNDDLSLGAQFADLACGGYTVEIAGHFEVHEDDIGLMLFNGGHCRCAGINFGDDLNIGKRMQKSAYTLTYDLVIIYE